MSAQFNHFMYISAGATAAILLGAFGLLSSDPTDFGIIANVLGIFVTILAIALAVRWLMKASKSKASISASQVIQNVIVLSASISCAFYAILAFIFDWPTNLVRNMPMEYTNSPLTVALGAFLPLLAVLLWGGWTVWLALRRGKTTAPATNN